MDITLHSISKLHLNSVIDQWFFFKYSKHKINFVRLRKYNDKPHLANAYFVNDEPYLIYNRKIDRESTYPGNVFRCAWKKLEKIFEKIHDNQLKDLPTTFAELFC